MGKGGNPFKQIGRGIEGIGKTAKNLVGGLTGGAIGKNPQEDLLRQQRAEAEAKARAEAEAKRQAELERQRKAEEDYRNKVKTDTENMQRDIDGLQNKQQGTNLIDKPQTTVDFSKSFKIGNNKDEDKLKKIFKAGR
ncbi:hypothetical protein AB6N29_03590 [Fusobacterium animalis]|uniref:hypothetical protein n=1 Tax=Fusobacterium animalis TaxID=76859 RepID=UPI0034DFFC9A